MAQEEPFNRWRSHDLWAEYPQQVNSYKGVQTITATVPVRCRTMADVTKPPRLTGGLKPHPLEVREFSYSPPFAAPMQTQSWSWVPEVVTWVPRPDLRTVRPLFEEWASQNRFGDLEGWRQDAFDQFAEIFPPEIDLGNFLWEAREIGALVPSIEGGLLKSAGGLHLWWSFGVAPTLADLDSLANILVTVRDRLKQLRRHNGTRRKLKRKRKFAGVPAFPPEIWWTRGPDSGGSPFVDDYWSATLVQHSCEFRAVCRLRQDLDIPEGLEGTVRGLIAALGLNNPLGTAWQSIPYSFLLDWVLDVGGLFRRHAIPTFTGVYAVEDFSVSRKETWSWKVEYRYPDATRAFGSDPVSLDSGTVSVTFIDRSVNWPSGFPTLSFPPSAGQAALLASLIAAST